MIDLPKAFEDSDAVSLRAQHRFIRSTSVQLALLIVAGVAGVIPWETDEVNISALIAGLAFIAAAAFRLNLIRVRPHRAWYEGRAVAESVKTLCWRYAVAGNPFPLSHQDPSTALSSQIGSLFQGVSITNSPVSTEGDPTPSMEDLRARPLADRKEAYRFGRIGDQLDWYARKAAWNKSRARKWSIVILALQLGAATGAFLLAFKVMEIDLFGLAGAIVASGAAWVETKQYGTISNAYRVAADELRRIESLQESILGEAEWARFVGDSEEAISREHTMWKASSSRLEPVSLI